MFSVVLVSGRPSFHAENVSQNVRHLRTVAFTLVPCFFFLRLVPPVYHVPWDWLARGCMFCLAAVAAARIQLLSSANHREECSEMEQSGQRTERSYIAIMRPQRHGARP